MKLFAYASCDEVSINNRYYEDFYNAISNTTFYDEDKINDLIYYAYEIYEELKLDITKKQLLDKIADMANSLSFDNIMELKAFEFQKLLDASQFNYNILYYNIVTDNNFYIPLQ